MKLAGVAYTFTASFGINRTGKTVSVSIIDTSGSEVLSGFTAGAVVELSDGSYGCSISFSSAFNGYVRFSDTTDSLEIYVPVTIISDYRTDIDAIKKIELNRWKIASNQLTIYDDDGITPLYVFNLYKEGVLNGAEPDERVPA